MLQTELELEILEAQRLAERGKMLINLQAAVNKLQADNDELKKQIVALEDTITKLNTEKAETNVPV